MMKSHESQDLDNTYRSASYSSAIPMRSISANRAEYPQNESQQAGRHPSTEQATPLLKKISAGITFRQTKRGFYIYKNDQNEKVFMDEFNRLHKLDDGYDFEDTRTDRLKGGREESVPLRQKHLEESQNHEAKISHNLDEPKIISTVAAESEGLIHLKKLLQQLKELVDERYRQYDQVRQAQLKHSQNQPYLQQLEQYFIPLDQGLQSKQQTLFADIEQLFQHRASVFGIEEMFEFLEGGGDTRELCEQLQHCMGAISHTLRQLNEKKQQNKHIVLLQQAQKEIKACSFLLNRPSNDSQLEENLKRQYFLQQQSLDALIQAVEDETSLVTFLQSSWNQFFGLQKNRKQELLNTPQPVEVSENGPRLSISGSHVAPEANLATEDQKISYAQKSLSGVPMQRDNVLASPHEATSAAATSQNDSSPETLLSRQRLTTNDTGSPSAPKFAQCFDSQRRPLYIDPSGLFFRYNANRVREYLSEEELGSLQLH